MTDLEVVAVPILSDNYVWLAHEGPSGTTVVIDPGAPAPVLAALAKRGWRADAIWITHWHPDHVGGLAAVKAATGAEAWGPAAEAPRIPGLDHLLVDGDRVRAGPIEAAVIATPGHTAGHIAFHVERSGALFPGDTLFAMGCGRLMEGTPADMHASLQTLAALPDETQVYAAHEYTLENARWARTAEPDNAALAERADEVERLRAAGRPTLPTTIALERATNPFVRAPDADVFARLRRSKDRFAG